MVQRWGGISVESPRRTTTFALHPIMSHPEDSGCIAYLKALSDETRWEIMRLLTTSAEPLILGEIARRLGLSAYNASRHVRVLNEAGLLRVVRDGRFKRISVAPEWRQNWQNAAAKGTLDFGCCRFDFTQEAVGKTPSARS